MANPRKRRLKKAAKMKALMSAPVVEKPKPVVEKPKPVVEKPKPKPRKKQSTKRKPTIRSKTTSID